MAMVCMLWCEEQELDAISEASCWMLSSSGGDV
jgi:hypothetical protein